MEKNNLIIVCIFSAFFIILYPIIWSSLFFDQFFIITEEYAKEAWISIYSITKPL